MYLSNYLSVFRTSQVTIVYTAKDLAHPLNQLVISNSSFIIHEKYSEKKGIRHDIGLVQLPTPFPSSRYSS